MENDYTKQIITNLSIPQILVAQNGATFQGRKYFEMPKIESAQSCKHVSLFSCGMAQVLITPLSDEKMLSLVKIESISKI